MEKLRGETTKFNKNKLLINFDLKGIDLKTKIDYEDIESIITLVIYLRTNILNDLDKILKKKMNEDDYKLVLDSLRILFNEEKDFLHPLNVMERIYGKAN